MFTISFKGTMKPKDDETVIAKFVILNQGVYYFYSKIDQSDLDTPIAIYDREQVSKIIKTNKEDK